MTRVVATVGGAGRGRPPCTHIFFFWCVCVPDTIFHYRGSIIAQYTGTLKMTLSGSEFQPGPLDPRSQEMSQENTENAQFR